MNKFLDAEKAIEAILYISKKSTDLFHIVKTLYFADKLHLEHYGRLITGDCYVAMREGPVPSGAYDLIKFARGDEYQYESKIKNAHPEKAFIVKGNDILPQRETNLDVFSESDIECLDEALKTYSQMNALKLWNEVHREKSYKETQRNKQIPLSKIIELDIPNGNEILDYLNN